MRNSDTLGGMRKPRLLIAVLSITALATALVSCSDSSSSASTEQVGKIELTPASNVIDVRSAEEFAQGFVKGATNLNVENGDLAAGLEDLDKEAPYSVYCRSGRRSAIAVQMMKDAGFTNVTDLGSLESAAQSLSLPIVTE